jgi:hypothetical protein
MMLIPRIGQSIRVPQRAKSSVVGEQLRQGGAAIFDSQEVKDKFFAFHASADITDLYLSPAIRRLGSD